MYTNGRDFNPGRFLKDGQINPDVKNPEEMMFGWGRRYSHSKRTPVLYLGLAEV